MLNIVQAVTLCESFASVAHKRLLDNPDGDWRTLLAVTAAELLVTVDGMAEQQAEIESFADTTAVVPSDDDIFPEQGMVR